MIVAEELDITAAKKKNYSRGVILVSWRIPQKEVDTGTLKWPTLMSEFVSIFSNREPCHKHYSKESVLRAINFWKSNSETHTPKGEEARGKRGPLTFPTRDRFHWRFRKMSISRQTEVRGAISEWAFFRKASSPPAPPLVPLLHAIYQMETDGAYDLLDAFVRGFHGNGDHGGHFVNAHLWIRGQVDNSSRGK